MSKSKEKWQCEATIVALFLSGLMLVATICMAVATAFMADFACQANRLADHSLMAENRPDLSLGPCQLGPERGIQAVNTGKGPAALLAIWMGGPPEPFRMTLGETYVPVKGQYEATDKRLATILDEMIVNRGKSQTWGFDEKRPAWEFYLVYKDIFDNVYRQDFLWQPQAGQPNPIWQKGCTMIGKFTDDDPYAEKLFKRTVPRAFGAP